MPASQYTKLIWNKWSIITKLSNYVVLDLETTGLSPKTEKIIEIGIIKVLNGQKSEELSFLVNPERPISSRITKITGLTDSDLISAPLFHEISSSIVSFIGDFPILGHNITFDLSFLIPALDTCNIHTGFQYLDTLQLARKAFPNLENHKLETLIKEFSLAQEQTHRALNDVHCTLALFKIICNIFSDSDLMDAIASCCTPIENAQICPIENPLAGKSFILIGAFTFSYSAAQKLISVAGGTVSKNITEATDYLVYGFQDPVIGDTNGYHNTIAQAFERYAQGWKIQLINEVQLLKLCGVSFF